ncbi:MAG: hypothetical protein CMJ85_10440 [Planctomycetes bacterium]|nr:hypothetical protein [Planctomycetota bacterium]
MFRQHLYVHAAQGERDFRWRGHEISRIEGLTDGVFALAIALLVISMEVPRTFDELAEAFVQTPVFLACFATLFWCWHAHFQFHRRYGLENPLTLFLNGVLIFLVALYVYPLKFLFGLLWNGMILRRGFNVLDSYGNPVLDGEGRHIPAVGEIGDHLDLMTLYGLGFAAVFGIFFLMTLHAWAWRERLELDARERVLTKAGLWAHAISVGFGAGSALIAGFARDPLMAGCLYFGIGPLQTVNGIYWDRRVGRLRPAVERAEELADDPVGGS